MHAKPAEVPRTVDADEVEIRETEWGDVHFTFEIHKQEIDTTPLMKGLPDDRCQCPHWGYVLKGRKHVDYGDYEETVEAGEAFYLEPGHLVINEEGTEFIEFSPRNKYQEMMNIIMKNIEQGAI